MANAVEFVQMGVQSGTERTIFVTWNWSKTNTKEYSVRWWYGTEDGNGFFANETTEQFRTSVYTAPDNAVKVTVYVRPISNTHTVNGSEVNYWTVDWSSPSSFWLKNAPPTKPNTPSVDIEDYKLTARLDNINYDPIEKYYIEFQVVQDDLSVFKSSRTSVKTNSAQYSTYVNSGHKYKVRCRAVNTKGRSAIYEKKYITLSGTNPNYEYSEWSDYSDNVETKPAASSGITVCRAESETSVYLEWGEVKTATSYEIQYTTSIEAFTVGSSDVSNETGITSSKRIITGLESGHEYFFRVRAVNEKGNSEWSGIESVRLGEPPSAPTTWSSTTTCIVGESLVLYWQHNAEDESPQTYAELEMYVNGVKETHIIDTVAESDDNKTMQYKVDTSAYEEGVVIQWRVRTSGVTLEYGEWSIQRTIDIYAPPTLMLNMLDANTTEIETLTSFPFYIKGTTGPVTQTPIGYYVTITSNEAYETTDRVGNIKMINAGTEIYAKHYDTTDQLLLKISAGDIDLVNNVRYTISCIVSMDSGLTAESAVEFVVGWSVTDYNPDAEIGIDWETLTAFIKPYCEDDSGNIIEGVTLSVYRREFDGSFTELATGLENNGITFITDPHPALDYARYRIVAMATDTGSVSFYDIPGYPVNEKSVVIQWDEAWSTFDATEDETAEQMSWAGSLLKLPYNIDVSDSHSPDISLVEYIGRKHPVSYYGTHLGESSTWNVEIPKSDKDTLYAIRRLAIWMGDVYVREPSGSGYWASITVSFSQTHCELTIPVTFDIVRVEGGI